jgi:hypothetical protein
MGSWIRDAANIRVPLTAKGVLIGRSSACAIIVDEPVVSRRHALVLSAEDAQILPLGKRGIVVGGVTRHEPTLIRDGDVFMVGSARFTLELTAAKPQPGWQVAVGDRSYPIDCSVFTIGGDPNDNLFLSDWPPRACALHAASGQLIVERDDLCELIGARLHDGFEAVSNGALLRRGATEIRFVEATAAGLTADEPMAPVGVVLEFVPNGALLHIKLKDDHTVFLAQKRGDLVAALLNGGPGARAGEWMGDETLMARVWGHQGASRTQLNVLVHRVRQSLTEAGLSGPALLQRAPGGGATRFLVASNASVSVI